MRRPKTKKFYSVPLKKIFFLKFLTCLLRKSDNKGKIFFPYYVSSSKFEFYPFRKRMSDAAPRRASTRIEKLKQQREEQDRIVAVAIQAELLHSETNADDGHESKDNPALTPPEAPLKPKSKKIDEDEWLVLKVRQVVPRPDG